MIDPKLLDLLVCPLTKSKLIYNESTNELWSNEAGLAYPVRDGIPVMVVSEARKLTDEEESNVAGE
ncbi:MAG: Trm112 family protein [Gammaproteobacteria bacterium]|nr:Trm112 family protein [Gammaproteobacteria bacterium]